MLTVKELAPGVYAVLPHDAFTRDHVATTAGIVIGQDGVLLVETMVNEALTQQLLALVRSKTGLPIRYVVNTSYHGDHSYGNYLVNEQALIVQHPATASYIRDHFEEDRAFMLDLIGRGRGIEGVRGRRADILVTDRLTLDLGERIVDIRHFGFAQTAGDLVVWLPEEKVLWVGNMIQAPPPALPWLLEGRHRESLATLRRVREFLPEGATIVPGHGRPMTPSEIDFSVRYLVELDRIVSDAVAQGLSLDETQERARMPEFASYSLFDWAHRTVNVPKIYEALADLRSLW